MTHRLVAAFLTWLKRLLAFIRSSLWPRARSTEPWAEAETHFGSRGMHYYVGGRFLSLSQQFPVSANLLHHAVEMLLKAALSRTHPRAALQAMQHNLRKAWLAFKGVHPDPRLNALDAAVSSLNKFENLRYPDDALLKGMVGMFALERSHVMSHQTHAARPSPQYVLVLEDVDELVQLIFEVGGMNPHFYLNGTHPRAIAVLNEHNLHPFPPAA